MENLTDLQKDEQVLEKIENQGERKTFLRKIIFFTLAPGLFFIVWILLFSYLPYLQETYVKIAPLASYDSLLEDTNPVPLSAILAEDSRVKKLDKAYARFSTHLPYLIINTSDNTFRLFNNGKLVREGICSTGSFVLLDAGGEQKWMFETPKGMKRIQGKTESPVWRKPDWAFVEEGLPIPKHQNSFERYEYGVLGDYALSIGNGYMIHGTLYKRFLGMPVTHGCVRMDDADLEKVFYTLSIGSKVYIF